MKILVTGGAGFIGSAVVRHIIEETIHSVVNVDKLTYAGNLNSLTSVSGSERYAFEQVDICDLPQLSRVFTTYQPQAVIHLAAESHVDRSINGPAQFIQSNIVGTSNLLEAARAYWHNLDKKGQTQFRFLHVSTDEVYGSLGNDGLFHENTPYRPTSPYAASKASSDHLVRAWHHTYGLPILITNCSNNYGPYQFPEKLIPLMILNGLEGKSLPVYGKGENVRDWLFVEDHARALLTVLENGEIGGTYNIGGHCEKQNIEVVKEICNILDEMNSVTSDESDEAADNSLSRFNHHTLIKFVLDRPGHDLRYAIDDTRIRTELGWTPRESFETGLRKTVCWYIDNPEWVRQVRTGEYRQWIKNNYEMLGRHLNHPSYPRSPRNP